MYKFNPFTNKLDNVGSWRGITIWQVAPQSWNWSPAWSIASRFRWDRYVDTVSWIEYQNPNASWTSGWEVIQSSPSI